jgi:hypothetical protein
MQGHRLHEVHTGGISSFSLTNMGIAHLMAEGYRLPDQAPQQEEKETNQDLGHLLWGFLVRFGKVFDYFDQAVSINQVDPLVTLINWSPCCCWFTQDGIGIARIGPSPGTGWSVSGGGWGSEHGSACEG